MIRTFRGSAALIAGQQDLWDGSSTDYRLSDVKVGDKVFTILRAAGDEDLCLTIRIQRRPSGLVPPAPFEKPDTLDEYHDMMNGYQAHEERGVPLPRKYDPEYQRFLREQLEREDEVMRKKRDRTAPPPRPAVRK